MNRVCSIFSQIFQLIPRPALNRRFAGIKPSAMRGALAVGASSWPCCSANWAGPSRYARSPADWPPGGEIAASGASASPPALHPRLCQ